MDIKFTSAITASLGSNDEMIGYFIQLSLIHI